MRGNLTPLASGKAPSLDCLVQDCPKTKGRWSCNFGVMKMAPSLEPCNPMQTVALPQVEFDPTTGEMRTSYAFRDIEIIVQGQLVEGQLSGDWEVTGMGIGGQWSTIAEEQSEPVGEQHPAAGVWNLTLQGLSAWAFPPTNRQWRSK